MTRGVLYFHLNLLTITGSKVEWLTTNFCPGGPRMKGGIRPGPPRIPLDRARLIFSSTSTKDNNRQITCILEILCKFVVL